MYVYIHTYGVYMHSGIKHISVYAEPFVLGSVSGSKQISNPNIFAASAAVRRAADSNSGLPSLLFACVTLWLCMCICVCACMCLCKRMSVYLCVFCICRFLETSEAEIQLAFCYCRVSLAQRSSRPFVFSSNYH